MKNFYFAGVARSKSVRPIDDGVGPQMTRYSKQCHDLTRPFC